MLQKVIFFSIFFLLSGNSTLMAETCQQFFVTSSDGYVNIRSSPEIKGNNVIATLPSGSSVQLTERHQTWLKIKLPLTGWLAGNQISRVSCDQGHNLLINLGLPTMNKLGKNAAGGNQKAAETLVKMSPYVDGIVQEAYAGVLVKWADHNPKFLVSILDRQTQAIRQSVLFSLDFGLGINSSSRQKFENFMQSLSPKSVTYKDWKKSNPVYRESN